MKPSLKKVLLEMDLDNQVGFGHDQNLPRMEGHAELFPKEFTSAQEYVFKFFEELETITKPYTPHLRNFHEKPAQDRRDIIQHFLKSGMMDLINDQKINKALRILMSVPRIDTFTRGAPNKTITQINKARRHYYNLIESWGGELDFNNFRNLWNTILNIFMQKYRLKNGLENLLRWYESDDETKYRGELSRTLYGDQSSEKRPESGQDYSAPSKPLSLRRALKKSKLKNWDS